jgi:hypothetical protein
VHDVSPRVVVWLTDAHLSDTFANGKTPRRQRTSIALIAPVPDSQPLRLRIDRRCHLLSRFWQSAFPPKYDYAIEKRKAAAMRVTRVPAIAALSPQTIAPSFIAPWESTIIGALTRPRAEFGIARRATSHISEAPKVQLAPAKAIGTRHCCTRNQVRKPDSQKDSIQESARRNHRFLSSQNLVQQRLILGVLTLRVSVVSALFHRLLLLSYTLS